MIKYSASKVLIIAIAVLLTACIAGCGKREGIKAEGTTAAGQTAVTENANGKEQITGTGQTADEAETEKAENAESVSGNTADADKAALPEEKDSDDYSAQELIDQIKNGEPPVLYGGASPEALNGLFADNSDGIEMDEEEAEVLKDFEFEEFEAAPYDPDAPWSDEGVVYELVEGADDVRPEAGKEADIGEDVSDDYSFLKLPAGTTPFADGTDWMVTFNGDADSCKEYISAVKKAGYTVDAEDTDMMGILMYEGSNSDGERASIMYTNGSISIIFEKQ